MARAKTRGLAAFVGQRRYDLAHPDGRPFCERIGSNLDAFTSPVAGLVAIFNAIIGMNECTEVHAQLVFE